MATRTEDKAVSEKVLWSWLQLAQPLADRDLHMERIENLVGAGNADVSGCYLGDYFDIENKTADRPALPGTVVLNSCKDYVRPAQKVWHRLRWASGGSCFFLIQVGRQKGALRYLIPGLFARSIEDKTEAQLLDMAVIDPREGPLAFITRAATYRSTLTK